jgi:hypothetical protein
MLHLGAKDPKAYIRDRPGRSFVRRHPFDVQVLDNHRLVLAAEPSRELVHEIRSDVRDAWAALPRIQLSSSIDDGENDSSLAYLQWSNVTPRCGSTGLVKRTRSYSAFSRPQDKVEVSYRVH